MKKKIGKLWLLLPVMGFIGLIVLSKIGEESTKTPERAYCDAGKIIPLVDRLLSEKILYKVERIEQIVYVLDSWQALPFGEKEKIDEMIQCYITVGQREFATVTYRDYRTKKIVARSDRFGLKVN